MDWKRRWAATILTPSGLSTILPGSSNRRSVQRSWETSTAEVVQVTEHTGDDNCAAAHVDGGEPKLVRLSKFGSINWTTLNVSKLDVIKSYDCLSRLAIDF